MAFTDPQTLTINSVAKTLPRTSTTASSSVYSVDDVDHIKLSVAHSTAKRNRSVLRVDFSKTAPDPLISSTSVIYSMSVALTVDRPKTGFTNAEAKQIVDALSGYLTASAGANTVKFLGYES